jgi:hypothetical protein
MPAWVVPTARAIPWAPTAGVAACLVAVTAAAASSGTWPVGILDVAAAALAAAAAAGLRDPAAALLTAVLAAPAPLTLVPEDAVPVGTPRALEGPVVGRVAAAVDYPKWWDLAATAVLVAPDAGE